MNRPVSLDWPHAWLIPHPCCGGRPCRPSLGCTGSALCGCQRSQGDGALALRRVRPFARDQAIRPDSDVDLLVSFQAGRKDFDAYLELVDHLEMLLARRVDLVTTEALSRHLAASVLGEALDVALDA